MTIHSTASHGDPGPSAVRPGKEKRFHGWTIVAVAFLANFMAVGTGFYAMNAFMEPLCTLHGWSRTDVNLALVCASVTGFLGQFIYGSLLPRIQIRRLMLAGVVTAGGAYTLLMRVPALWQFCLLYTLLYLANGAYSGIVANAVVSNWFLRKRGRALGIATSGISLAGAVIPILAMLVIQVHGVQAAALCIAVLILAQAPFIWRVVRDWPEDCGLWPDGLPPDDADPSGADVEQTAGGNASGKVWTAAALVRSGNFWKLGFAFSLLMSGAVGVMSQLKPRFADIGFGDLQAMALLTLTALMATVGKYAWGRLCDYRTPWRVGGVLASVNALGLAMTFFGASLPAVLLFIIVFGFAVGGVMSLYPVITASLFGRYAFTSVYRFMSLFLILQVAGYLIAGQSYDRLGSYDAAYAVFILFDVIAAILLCAIHR